MAFLRADGEGAAGVSGRSESRYGALHKRANEPDAPRSLSRDSSQPMAAEVEQQPSVPNTEPISARGARSSKKSEASDSHDIDSGDLSYPAGNWISFGFRNKRRECDSIKARLSSSLFTRTCEYFYRSSHDKLKQVAIPPFGVLY